MSKFSSLAARSISAATAQEQAESALAEARSAQVLARAGVVAALKSQGIDTAALDNPDGSVSVYALTPGRDDYAVTVVPGDFDVADQAPAEPAEPGPAASPA